MIGWLTDNARAKRFGTTVGAVWGLWVPFLLAPPVRVFMENHPWVAAAQGPFVATVTLMVGEYGRARQKTTEGGT